MSYGYGGRPNPYDQRGGAPGGSYDAPYDPPTSTYNAPQQERYNSTQRGDYNAQPYGNTPPVYGTESQYNSRQPAMGRDPYATNVEMQPLAPNGEAFARQDPKAILNESRRILDSVQEINSYFGQVQMLQTRSMNTPNAEDQRQVNANLDNLNTQVMQKIREASSALRTLKQKPESGNPPYAAQVSLAQKKLQDATRAYQSIEATYQKKVQDKQREDYMKVRPDATREEIEQAIANPSSQGGIFTQALMQSTRNGQATSTLNNVRSRNNELKKVEQQMIELSALFAEMAALVEQQEAAVTVIEQKGEEVVENLDKGNEQLDSGIKSARARNRKKWWCLLICVIIIVIIVVVVIIYVKVINPPRSSKRSVVEALQARYLTAPQPWTPRGRLALQDTPWTA